MINFIKKRQILSPLARQSSGQALRRNSGQAMILSVMVLTMSILGAVSIAALLMLYQTRQAGDIISSAQALFAADAGIECGKYKQYKDNSFSCGAAAPISLSNGATFQVQSKTVGLKEYIISVGKSKSVARSFQYEF